MGGSLCRMSILRNGYVPCHYFYNFHVDFKIVPCRMSMLRNEVAVSNLGVKSPLINRHQYRNTWVITMGKTETMNHGVFTLVLYIEWLND